MRPVPVLRRALAVLAVPFLLGAGATSRHSSPSPPRPAAAVPDRAALVAGRASRAAVRPTPTTAAPTTTAAPGPAKARPAAGPVTGWWGEGRGSHRHAGIDFDGATGDPVWAAAAGTVVIAGPSPPGYRGYGTIVVVDHGGGVQTRYAHLSRVDVVAGQQVEAGTQLGAIGTSGHVTGSHLHFELLVGGAPVDPGPWLAAP